jgi:hypothetical protein
MMDSTLSYLMKELQERMTMLSEATARGHCSSFEEYKYTCGQLRGLESACAIIKDLEQKMENSDNE